MVEDLKKAPSFVRQLQDIAVVNGETIEMRVLLKG